MDVKAEKTQEHAEELRDHHDASVSRIAAYHRHIDTCTKEMKDCETRIDEYRARVRNQQDLIRTRRAEANTLRQEADRCRAGKQYSVQGPSRSLQSLQSNYTGGRDTCRSLARSRTIRRPGRSCL